MSVTEDFSRQQIKELIAEIDEIVADFGEAVNPRYVRNDRSVSTTCVYEKLDPGPGEHYRCIVGEIAYRHGWTMPEPNNTNSATTVAKTCEWPLTQSAVAFLTSVQREFDDVTVDPEWKTVTQPTWRAAWNKFKSKNPRYFTTQ